MYMCPVCGFNKLEFPADNYNICPSCGTEFGLDDVGASYEDLRSNWQAKGMQWWSMFDEKPVNWNPLLQLQNLGFVASNPESSTAVTRAVYKTTWSHFDFQGSFNNCHA